MRSGVIQFAGDADLLEHIAQCNESIKQALAVSMLKMAPGDRALVWRKLAENRSEAWMEDLRLRAERLKAAPRS